MAVETPTPRETDVRGCARCEGDHDGLEFQPLGRPIEIEGANVLNGSSLLNRTLVLSHWATCPTTGEPILLTFIGEDG